MDILKNKKNKISKKVDYFSLWQQEENSRDEKEYQVYEMGKTYDADDEFSGNYFYRQVNSKKKKTKNFKIKTNWFKEKLAVMSVALFAVFLFVGAFAYINKGVKAKKQVLGVSQEAYGNLNQAINDVKKQNFLASANKFNDAYNNFLTASTTLEELGKTTISLSRFFPYTSKLSSGYNLAQVGEHLSLAGKNISEIGQIMDSFKKGTEKTLPVLDVFRRVEDKLNVAEKELKIAQEKLVKVNFSDIPDDSKEKALLLKNELPMIVTSVETFFQNNHIIADLLGANGPRKYLFLFQNNQEMRATGGFIGSYGLLDISGEGRVRNFFIDGIFNPDGQMTENIVPPRPLQKITGGWSLHDSNWFPDFPLSAEKAILFYERTGGPTVDGVITLTPTVIQKLLRITGPIRMDDYDTTLTANNFVRNIQYEVEEDYDKLENRPKKILADLAPILMNKLFEKQSVESLLKTMNILGEALAEKHILIYSRNKELQNIISELGWSGEMLTTDKDYLSVINTNINGYKTDGIIKQEIEHFSEIAEDGSIIDTVKITRQHNGGKSEYEWWNKVNSNYLRIYVPQGSELLSVEGQTPEIIESPLDYKLLKFATDVDVVREEKSIKLNPETNTRIYQSMDKTVFADWTYVSPGEKLVVIYKYRLPFKINFSQDKNVNSYSLLMQKQSGSLNTSFSSKIEYPKSWITEWSSGNLKRCSSEERSQEAKCLSTNLTTDKFFGMVFSKQ